MRSAICSKWSSWEFQKDEPPMIHSIGMSFVTWRSSQTSYLLGTGVQLGRLP